jgi:hypothetical protein
MSLTRKTKVSPHICTGCSEFLFHKSSHSYLISHLLGRMLRFQHCLSHPSRLPRSTLVTSLLIPNVGLPTTVMPSCCFLRNPRLSVSVSLSRRMQKGLVSTSENFVKSMDWTAVKVAEPTCGERSGMSKYLRSTQILLVRASSTASEFQH